MRNPGDLGHRGLRDAQNDLADVEHGVHETGTLFENEYIRQGILLGKEFAGLLPSAQMQPFEVSKILTEIMAITGLKQAALAKKIGTSQGSISKWLSDQHGPTLKQWEPVLALIRSDKRLRHLLQERRDTTSIPVMGRVGAGALIEPEYDQIPPEGLFSVELPFPVPDEMIGLEVSGDSMMPRYDEGDVIVCWRDQRNPTDTYIGAEAAVRTEDGRRYLKSIHRGSRGTFELHSFNARPISGVRIAWVGEIYLTFRAGQIRRIAAAQKASTTKRAKERSRQTADMKELPLDRRGK